MIARTFLWTRSSGAGDMRRVTRRTIVVFSESLYHIAGLLMGHDFLMRVCSVLGSRKFDVTAAGSSLPCVEMYATIRGRCKYMDIEVGWKTTSKRYGINITISIFISIAFRGGERRRWRGGRERMSKTVVRFRPGYAWRRARHAAGWRRRTLYYSGQENPYALSYLLYCTELY